MKHTPPSSDAVTCHSCARLEKIIAEGMADTYLIMTIAKIREATGVGARPMLSELPDAIAAKMQPNEPVDNAKRPVADLPAPGVT